MTQPTIEEMIEWMGLKDGELWASDDDEKMFQHVCAALTAQPTIELKPCPFCGGAGAIHPNGIGDYYVRCNLCESRTDQARCEEPEHAAKRWNTRSALTAQALPWRRESLPTSGDGKMIVALIQGRKNDIPTPMTLYFHNGKWTISRTGVGIVSALKNLIIGWMWLDEFKPYAAIAAAKDGA